MNIFLTDSRNNVFLLKGSDFKLQNCQKKYLYIPKSHYLCPFVMTTLSGKEKCSVIKTRSKIYILLIADY